MITTIIGCAEQLAIYFKKIIYISFGLQVVGSYNDFFYLDTIRNNRVWLANLLTKSKNPKENTFLL